MDKSQENLRIIEERIAVAAQKSGRNPADIMLVGASKTVPAEKLRPFIQSGLRNLGENYIQEGIAKQQELTDLPLTWHCIGSLQSNKSKLAVAHFEWIHGVDRSSLIKALEKAAAAENKSIKVLLQVNVGDESSKSGCRVEDFEKIAEQCLERPHLDLRGLMCLPPFSEDAESTRKYFSLLRDLGDKLRNIAGLEKVELSMGMSHDFEVAIEEGATMVRVGTALFGKRD